VPSARPPCDASWAGEEGTGWVHGGVEGNRGRKADPKAGREAEAETEAAAEKRKREKTENFCQVRFPEGFGTKKVAHFVWGKRPTRATPILKRSPAAENGQVNHCTHNFRPNGVGGYM
jgi:hypothetical protein